MRAFIELKNACLNMPVYGAGAISLKNHVLRLGSKIRNQEGKYMVNSMCELDLVLSEGDRVGLVGPNGSGKTTLLRVLAGIYELSSGSLRVHGKVVPLLDLSFGMDENSTGRENIMLRGLLLGMSRSEILFKMPEIEKFSELGDYLELPMRVYSAGMRMRLAFSVSTAVDADILLLDEIMGVGDDRFQKQASSRLHTLKQSSGIVVMANHSISAIKDNCNKVLWLDSGKKVLFGNAEDVLQNYTDRV